MDAVDATLLTFGIACLLVSWVLLLIDSWSEDFSWGLFTVLLPPLSYFYALFRLDKAGNAILMAVIGWLLIWLAL